MAGKRYINYSKNRGFFLDKKRPGNQRDAIEKIILRINRLILLNGVELEEPQQLLLNLSNKNELKLKDNNLNIAHNISIGYLLKEFVYLLNHRNEIHVDAGNSFAEEILSTDDEEILNFRNFLPRLKEEVLTPETIPVILNYVNNFIFHLNRASKNLMPGFASPNQSIGDKRDPHTIKKNGRHQETEHSRKIAEKTNLFFRYRIEPKERINGQIVEYQSSSINKEINYSWYQHIEPELNGYETDVEDSDDYASDSYASDSYDSDSYDSDSYDSDSYDSDSYDSDSYDTYKSDSDVEDRANVLTFSYSDSSDDDFWGWYPTLSDSESNTEQSTQSCNSDLTSDDEPSDDDRKSIKFRR